MAADVKIRISSTADTGGMDRATTKLEEMEQAAHDFLDTLKLGIGIDIGGRLVQGFAELPGIFAGLIERGVRFNATMSDSEIAIANVLKQFKGLSDEAAKGEAAAAMQQIIALEPQTAGTLQSLTEGFLATVAAGQNLGLTVEENIDLVGKFANALANANLPAEQLAQELRAIFTGNITPDAAIAKLLEIDPADLERARASGDAYDYLVGKVGSLGEAGDTAGVAWSTLQSTIDKALGQITAPVFEALVEAAKDLNAALSDPEAVEQLEALGFEIAQVVKNGAALTEWAVKNADGLLLAAKGAAALGAAMAAWKFGKLIGGLASMATRLVASRVAIDAETAALGRNTAAQRANAGARGSSAAGAGRGGRLAGMAGTGSVILAAGAMGTQALVDHMNAESDRRESRHRRLSERITTETNEIQQLGMGVTNREERLEAQLAIIEKVRRLQIDGIKLSGEEAALAKRTADSWSRIAEKIGQFGERDFARNAAREASEEAADMSAGQAEIDAVLRVVREQSMDRQHQGAVADAAQRGDVPFLERELEGLEFRRDQAMRDLDPSGGAEGNAEQLDRVQALQEQVDRTRELLQATKDVAAENQRRREDLQAEVEATRQELAGREELAQRMRQERQIRREIADLVEQGVLTEERGTQVVSERLALLDEADAQRQAEIERQREEYELEVEIAELRASGNEAAADAAQRRLDVARETKRLEEEMGYSPAEAASLASRSVGARASSRPQDQDQPAPEVMSDPLLAADTRRQMRESAGGGAFTRGDNLYYRDVNGDLARITGEDYAQGARPPSLEERYAELQGTGEDAAGGQRGASGGRGGAGANSVRQGSEKLLTEMREIEAAVKETSSQLTEAAGRISAAIPGVGSAVEGKLDEVVARIDELESKIASMRS